MNQWMIGGIALDVAGAALIATSLPEGGLQLGFGIAVMLAGTVAIRKGAGFGSTVSTIDEEQLQRSLKSWRPTAELERDPPRAVRLTRMAWLIAFCWAAMFAAGGWFSYDRVWRLNPPIAGQQLLEQEGVRVRGEVHRHEVRSNAGGRSVYYLYYNFADEKGAGVRSSISVSKSLYDDYSEGSAIEVIHLPGDAMTHLVPAFHRGTFAGRGAVIGLAAAVFLLVVLDGRRRKHKALARDGRAVGAVVEGLQRKGGSKSYHLRYRAHGREQRLKVHERNPNRKAGDVVTVLYDPAHPATAVLYRLCLYRAV
jgi:hypothetical protein